MHLDYLGGELVFRIHEHGKPVRRLDMRRGRTIWRLYSSSREHSMSGSFRKDPTNGRYATRITSRDICFRRASSKVINDICKQYKVPVDVFLSKQYPWYLKKFRALVAKELAKISVDGMDIPAALVLEAINRNSYAGLSGIISRDHSGFEEGLAKWRFVEEKGYRKHRKPDSPQHTWEMAKTELGEPYFSYYKLYTSKYKINPVEALRLAREDKAKDERSAIRLGLREELPNLRP